MSNRKKTINFFKIEETPNGDISWNNEPIEKLGDSTLKITEDMFDISTNLRYFFTDRTEKTLKVVGR